MAIYDFQDVSAIINSWEPIRLLQHAPDDEYASEAGEIVELLDSKKDPEEVAGIVHTVFLRSFGSDTFSLSKTECRTIAARIINSAR